MLSAALVACGEGSAGSPATTNTKTISRSVPWTLVRADERRLVLRYAAGTCGRGDEPTRPRARVNETDESATVEVLARVVEANPCAGLVVAGRLRVRLDRPLGDRKLRHAPVAASQRALQRSAR